MAETGEAGRKVLYCLVCQELVCLPDIKSGRHTGHLLTEHGNGAGVVSEIKDYVQLVKMDKKYGRAPDDGIDLSQVRL